MRAQSLAPSLLLTIPFLAVCSSDAFADSVKLVDTRPVAETEVQVTIGWQYGSDHGPEASLVLRVLPAEAARSFDVSPRSHRIRKAEGGGTVTFSIRPKREGRHTVSKILVGFVGRGAGRSSSSPSTWTGSSRRGWSRSAPRPSALGRCQRAAPAPTRKSRQPSSPGSSACSAPFGGNSVELRPGATPTRASCAS